MTSGTDTRHRHRIDEIVAGTEDVARYVLSWDEAHDGGKMRCRMYVPSRMLARRIVEECFLQDDRVTKIDFRPIS